MPIDNSLQTIDLDKIFRTKLDTEQRLNATTIPGNQNPPEIKSYIPKGMKIEDAMFSPDYNIRSEAVNLYKGKLKQVVPSYESGVGSELTAPFSEAKKYINKDLGYDVRSNNEEVYYQEYLKDFNDGIPFNGTFKNIGRFLGRVIVPAATKLVTGTGYMGSMINPLNWGYGYWANVADNEFSKWMEGLEENFKDQVLPVYHSVDYNNKGFFSKLGDATMWTDSFADGVAFFAGAFAPSLLGNVTGLIGEGGSLFGEVGNLAKVANKAVGFLTGGDNWGEVGLWAFNTANEAAFEAAGVYKDTVANLKAKRESGDSKYKDMTDEEIRQIGGQGAANNFLANAAILTFSNAWEQRNMFKPLVGKIRGKKPSLGIEIVENLRAKAGKGTAPTTTWGKILDWGKYYGEKTLEGTAVEGYWEENAQLASQRINTPGNKDDITNPNDNKLYRFLDQLATQTYNATVGKDPEAAESIGLGGLISAFGLIGGGIVSGGKERKNRFGELSKEEAENIAFINNARANFLSVQNLVGEDGKIDPEKLKVAAQSLSRLTNQSIAAEDISNPAIRKYYQDSLFATYVQAVAKSGKFDNFIKRLSDISNKTPEQIKELGLDPSVVKTSNSELINLAKELKNIHDNIEEKDLTSPNQEERDFNTPNIIEHRKNLIYKYRADAIASRNIKNLDVENSSKALEIISKLASPIPLEVREVNVLNNLLQQTEQLIKDDTTPEFVKEQKKKEAQELKEKIKDLENKIPTTEEGKKYTKDKDGFFVGKDSVENKLSSIYTKAEASNRASNALEANKNFVADTLEDKEKGTKAYKDLIKVIKKQDKKTEVKDNEAKDEIISSINGILVKQGAPTTDEEFIKLLNKSLQPTKLEVKLINGKFRIQHRKEYKVNNTISIYNVEGGRKEVIEKLLEVLQDPINWPVVEPIESDIDQFSPEEADQYQVDELSLLDKAGEGYKKDLAIVAYTDTNPPFEKRFLDNKPILYRKEYLFHNYIHGLGAFKEAKPEILAIPITNLNIREVEKELGISENDLQFIIDDNKGYEFVQDGTIEQNRGAAIIYVFGINTKDGYKLIDKEGNIITGNYPDQIVIGTHIHRDTKYHLEKEDNKNPIRKDVTPKEIETIQQTMDKITNYFTKLTGFKAFGFEISNGLRNVPTKKVVSSETGETMHVSEYHPVSTIGTYIDESDIGKDAVVHVEKNTIRKSNGDRIIKGRPYLKYTVDNNTGTPTTRYEYLDNRKLTDEEKVGLLKAFDILIQKFNKDGSINKETDAYRYISGLIRIGVQNQNKTINIWRSEKGNFVIQLNGNSYTIKQNGDFSQAINLFTEYIANLYHRVDAKLLSEISDKKSNPEFLDIATGKQYPSYHHYLLSNVLTIRMKDKTENKPDSEPEFSRIQRYSIIDLSEVTGEEKSNIINYTPNKNDQVAKKQRTKGIKSKEDIILYQSDKKVESTSPVNQPATKNMINRLRKAAAKDAEENRKRKSKNNEELFDEEDDQPGRPNLKTKALEWKNKQKLNKDKKTEEDNIKPIIEEESPIEEAKSSKKIDEDVTSEAASKLNDIDFSEEFDDDDEYMKLEDLSFDDEEVSDWEIEEVLRILDSVELNKSDKDRIFKGRTVFGSTKWGNNKKAIITLYASARKGTGFHEAFETVYNFILSNEQQDFLINRFRNREGSFTTFNGETKPYSKATNKEAKEKMADEYADYKFGKPIPEKAPVGFFQRVWNFINKFIQSFLLKTSYGRNLRIKQIDLFEMMDAGKFRGIELKNSSNEYFSMSINGKEINPIESAQFLRSTNFLLFNILSKSNTNLLTSLEEGGELNIKIYDELRKEFTNSYNDPNRYKKAVVHRARQLAEQNIDSKIPNEFFQQQAKDEFTKALQYRNDITKDEKSWNEFVRIHKNYLSKFGISFEENIDDNIHDEKSGEKTNEYTNDKLKFDNFRSIPSSIKLLIASLTEKIIIEKKDSSDLMEQDVINPITLLPNSIDESQFVLLFNRIMNFLSGTNSIDSIKKRMDDFLGNEKILRGEIEDQKFYFAVKQLRQIIFKTNEAGKIDLNNFDKFEVKNLLRFVAAFAKQKPLFIRAKVNEDGEIYFADEAFESQVKYTANNFYNELLIRVISGKNKEKSYITKSGRKFSIVKNKIPVQPSIGKTNNSNIKEFAEFLNNLGFNYFTEERLNNMSPTDIGDIYDQSAQMIAELSKLSTIDSINPKGLGVVSRVNRISEIVAKYNSDDTNPQHMNPEGEMQMNYTDNNTISNIIQDMINVDSWEEFIELNPQYTNSYFMNSEIFRRFREEGEVPKVVIFSGMDEYGNVDGRTASNLTEEELYINRLIMAFDEPGRKAIYPIFENADGNIDWELQTGQYVRISDLFRGSRIEKMLKGYLIDDINSAIEYIKQDKKGQVENFTKKIRIQSKDNILMEAREAGKTLGFTSIFLTAEEINKINEFIDNYSDEDIQNYVNEFSLADGFAETMLEGASSDLAYLKLEKLISGREIKLVPKSIQQEFLDAFKGEESALRLLQIKRMNDFFSAVENTKLVFGRIQNFKSIEDSLKRFKSFLSPRSISIESKELNDWMNKTLNDVSSSDLTYHLHKSTTSFYSIADPITYSEGLVEINKKFGNNETTDGQSYGLISFLREIDYKSGAKFSESQEHNYNVHNAYERLKLDEKGIQPYSSTERREKDRKLLEPYLINGKYILQLSTPISIKKPIFSGIDSKGNTKLVKTSIVPLTYYLVEGTKMEDIYLDMRRNKADMLAFESAHKVGQVLNNEGKVGSIVSPEGTVLLPSQVAEIEEINKRNSSIQVETEGEHDKSSIGTQTTKIISTDMYSSGVPIDFMKDSEDRLKTWLSMSEQEKLDNSDLYKLERKHNQALSELYLHNYYSFLESLNIKEIKEDGVTRFESLDNKKFRDKIEEYVTKHGVPKNIIEQLEYDEETGETISYELMSDYTLIKSIIYSMIDKSLASPKLNGGQRIQMANMFFDKKLEGQMNNYDIFYEEEKGKWKKASSTEEIGNKKFFIGSPELKFYESDGKNSTRRMQVKISSRYLRMTNKKRQNLGLPVLNEQEFLQLIKENSPKLLEGIGFRIPTQAMNSLDAFEIVGFLPDFMGDAIAVPSEFPTKGGSDFDVDKLTTYLNNMYVDNEGIPRYMEFKDNQNSTLEERFLDLIKSKERDLYELYGLMRNSKEYLESGIDELLDSNLNLLEGTRDTITLAEKEAEEVFKEGLSIFSKLAIPIKQQYYEKEKELKKLNITSAEKTLSYIKYTNNWIKEFQSHDGLILEYKEYDEDLNETTHKVRVLSKNVLPILQEMIDNYNKYLESVGVTKEIIEEYLQLKDEKLEENRQAIINFRKKIHDVVAEHYGLPIFSEFSDLPLYRQNSRKAVENRLFQVMSDIILHPSSFSKLMRPNDSSRLDTKATNYARKLKGTNKKELFFNIKTLINSREMTANRVRFQSAKRLVGIAAVGTVSHSNFQKVTSVIIPKYSFYDEESGENIEKGKFIFPHNTVDTFATLSSINSKSGESISENNGSYVDGTVDTVKKPWLIDYGAYGVTFAPAVLANKLGYSAEHVALVINSPLVKEYQRLKNFWKSPAYQTDEDLKKKEKAIYGDEAFIRYFLSQLSMDEATYLKKRNYDILTPTEIEQAEKIIEISHHNIEEDELVGTFDFEFFKQQIKNNTDLKIVAVRIFEDFLNLVTTSSEVRASVSASNHETAHIKDNSITLSKEANLQLGDSYGLQALIGYDEKGIPIITNLSKEIRRKTFIGVLADTINTFENEFIYKEILLPQTQLIAKWIINSLSKNGSKEVFAKQAEEEVAEMEKTVMSAFLYDSELPTTKELIKDSIKAIVSLDSSVASALEIAIAESKKNKYDIDRFAKGLTVLENIKIQPENADDVNNVYYYLQIKKKPTANDSIGSESLYEGLKNLKNNLTRIKGTNYTYSDMYSIIMLHSIYRNGIGFSKNSILSYMDSNEYRAISQGILSMEITQELLQNQRTVMIQNRPYLAKTISYFKGPIIRIPIIDNKLQSGKSGKFIFDLLNKDNITAYQVNTQRVEDENIQYSDIILLPLEAKYSKESTDVKKTRKKEKVLGDNWQSKVEFLFYKAGSKKKGNKAEILLRNTRMIIDVKGEKYVVFQHLPLKGSRFSREYGSIRKQEDFQSKLRDENVPVYSIKDIEFFINQFNGQGFSIDEYPTKDIAYEEVIAKKQVPEASTKSKSKSKSRSKSKSKIKSKESNTNLRDVNLEENETEENSDFDYFEQGFKINDLDNELPPGPIIIDLTNEDLPPIEPTCQ